MASALYKDYLIVSAASHNRDTLEWKPWATICWRTDGQQHLYQIRFNQEIFKTAGAAEELSMNAARKWIDERPKDLALRS